MSLRLHESNERLGRTEMSTEALTPRRAPARHARRNGHQALLVAPAAKRSKRRCRPAEARRPDGARHRGRTGAGAPPRRPRERHRPSPAPAPVAQRRTRGSGHGAAVLVEAPRASRRRAGPRPRGLADRGRHAAGAGWPPWRSPRRRCRPAARQHADALQLQGGALPVHLMRTHRGVASGQPGSPRPIDEAAWRRAPRRWRRAWCSPWGRWRPRACCRRSEPLGKLRGRVAPLALPGAGRRCRWSRATPPPTCCAIRPTRPAPGPTSASPRNGWRQSRRPRWPTPESSQPPADLEFGP